MLWIISCVEPDDQHFKCYRIKIKEISSLLNDNSKDIYSIVKRTTEKLLSRIIEVHDNGTELQVALIASAEHNRRKGFVDIEISPKLKKYLLQLKENFTSVKLKYAFQLSSSYSLRIYEIVTQYRKLGERKLSIEELRRMLDIGNGKYLKWANFEARVLKPAKEEINSKSDLKISYKKIKSGRIIEAILFTIESNESYNSHVAFDNNDDSLSSSLNERVIKHGIPQKTASAWQDTYTPAQLTTALDALEATLARGSAIKNRAGWLRTALEQGWQDAEAERARTAKAKVKAEARESARQRESAARQASARRSRQTTLNRLIESLPERQEHNLREQLKARVMEVSGPLSPVLARKFQSPAVWGSPFVATEAAALLSETGLLADE